MLLGYEAIIKHRGGFLLAFPDCDYLSLITSGQPCLQLLLNIVGHKGKFCQG